MYLWLWWSTRILVEAANDSLNPGDTLNYTGRLFSKKGTYCLVFTPFAGSENIYLVVLSSNGNGEVWMKNQPVDQDSAVLSLNRSGVLTIQSQRGKPIILYSPPKAIYNTKATLLDTGNFVLQQLRPNGTNTLLWQSFDYPSDTLLPTQKLGVNHKTGHRWLVASGFTNALPPPGAFSLEWEHVEQELIIRRWGKFCWRSGKLKNNRFEYISEDAQRRLKYTLVSNGDENSFSFTTTKNEAPVRVEIKLGDLLFPVLDLFSLDRLGLECSEFLLFKSNFSRSIRSSGSNLRCRCASRTRSTSLPKSFDSCPLHASIEDASFAIFSPLDFSVLHSRLLKMPPLLSSHRDPTKAFICKLQSP
ncbi:hypothetical protein LR48_Vigan08g055200 [Vigna angularis]|uniref:Bulb-type lectin domain-containing protein n=1 Tax=Phaseolus angularis TaxID=3914 RepID=A0A0L9V3R8_PHAAN|nr:hypothetical protein LR48_Vigan08g055200 [Vigna angularis]